MDVTTISAIVVVCGLAAAALARVALVRAQPRRDAGAAHDPLGGLPDRRAVLTAATSWLQLPGPLRAVALVEVDPADDGLLAQAAQQLAGALRADDLVGRYGGGRFVLVLRGDSAAGLQGAVNRALDAIRCAEVAASAGLALVDPRDHDLHHALRAADAALRRANAQGRDRLVVASMADQPMSAVLVV